MSDKTMLERAREAYWNADTKPAYPAVHDDLIQRMADFATAEISTREAEIAEGMAENSRLNTAYNNEVGINLKLNAELESLNTAWQTATNCSSPEDAAAELARLRELVLSLKKWHTDQARNPFLTNAQRLVHELWLVEIEALKGDNDDNRKHS